MRTSIAILVLAFTSTAASTDVLAGPPGMTDPIDLQQAPAATRTVKYGHHILLADLALLGAAIGTEKGEFILAGLISGPIVHLIHGESGGAGLSFLSRAVLPIGGAFAGAALTCASTNDELCALPGVILGGGGGIVAALMVDYFALARKEVAATPSVLPVASVGMSGDFQVGLSGSF